MFSLGLIVLFFSFLLFLISNILSYKDGTFLTVAIQSNYKTSSIFPCLFNQIIGFFLVLISIFPLLSYACVVVELYLLRS